MCAGEPRNSHTAEAQVRGMDQNSGTAAAAAVDPGAMDAA